MRQESELMLQRPQILAFVGVPLLLVGIALIAKSPRTRAVISTSLFTYSPISAERGFDVTLPKPVYYLQSNLKFVPPTVRVNELFEIRYSVKLVDVTYPGRPGEKEKSVSRGEVPLDPLDKRTMNLNDFNTSLLLSSFTAKVSGQHLSVNPDPQRLSADGTTSWQAQFTERGELAVHVELKSDEQTLFEETKEKDRTVLVSGKLLAIRTYCGYFATVLGSLGSVTSLIEFVRKWREEKRKKQRPHRTRKSTPTE